VQISFISIDVSCSSVKCAKHPITVHHNVAFTFSFSFFCRFALERAKREWAAHQWQDGKNADKEIYGSVIVVSFVRIGPFADDSHLQLSITYFTHVAAHISSSW